ncbi:MAG TPA: GNAT family N-acetyltransferase [Acidimicrobiales bacterium]|jgi:predicted GNAT family acetyltransferase|nr:GNAT family N-acetyltransferase [Acidimicrobiales bacterium]
MAIEVRNQEGRSRYELVLDGEVVGIADYHDRGDALVFPHTEIEPRHRGKGLGEVLVRHAMDDVRAQGRTIVPTCWFVRDFLDANPGYAKLRAS